MGTPRWERGTGKDDGEDYLPFRAGATFAGGLTAMALLMGIVAAPAPAAGPPQIDASWVTDVTSTSANLRASINANGLSTTYRFDYISEAAYQANLNAVPPREGFFGAAKAPLSGIALVGSATTPLNVVQHVGSLAPNTVYRYRPVATNSAAPPGGVVGPEHVLISQETGVVFHLPDGRGWEMVSPVDKNGGAIAAPGALFGGGEFQAAAGGGAVTYSSSTAFPGAAGAPPASQYVSQRGGGGWSTQDVSTPLESAAYGDEPDGAPYRLFAADLSRSLLFGGLPCRGALPGCPAPNPVLPGSGAPAGRMAYYLREGSSGALSSLLHAADVAHSTVSAEHFEVSFAAATPDLAHVVLSSCAKLTANATEAIVGPGECDSTKQNLYEWSSGGLTLLNLLPGDTTGTPGATIAAPLGAVSANGSRVYFSEGGNLYLRQGATTVQADSGQGGGGAFQTASADGGVAFFTREVSLGDTHLYRYLAGGVATDLTPSGGVAGVLGASAAGDYVYYQDAGGLRQWHSGTTATVEAGVDAAKPTDFLSSGGTARVSADGTRLAFLSEAEVGGFDNTDADSGLPDTELYLYGPPPGGGAAQLLCVSCNPAGERPQGSASIPGALINGSTTAYLPRVLSTGGTRVFFDTSDELVLQDTDSSPDVYEWEAMGTGDCTRSRGCIGLISGGREDGGIFVDASASGADVYFVTEDSLVGTDPGSIDLYDARVGGGFFVPDAPIACIGDACQALPSAPDDPTPGTLTKNSGNPPVKYYSERSHKHRKHKRRHHRHKHGGRHGKRAGGDHRGRAR